LRLQKRLPGSLLTVGHAPIAAPLPEMAGVGSLTPIAKVDATLANKSELAVRSFRLFLEGML